MSEIAAVAVLATVLLWGMVTYNRFVRRRNHVLEAWSGIDVQLKRRHDLIPKLVDTVKAYARYEQDLLVRLATTRTGDLAQRASAESQLSRAIRHLFAVAEAYPELKANQSFLGLQRNLSEIEEQIQYARRYYNATVRELNVLVQSFPSNLVARLFRFAQATYFEIELVTQRAAPELGF